MGSKERRKSNDIDLGTKREFLKKTKDYLGMGHLDEAKHVDLGQQAFIEGVAEASTFGNSLFLIVNASLMKNGLKPVWPRGQCCLCFKKGTKKNQGFKYCDYHYKNSLD